MSPAVVPISGAGWICARFFVEVANDGSEFGDLNKKLSAKPSSTRNWHYCWTHCYSSEHSSQDLKKPRTGHDKGAKKADTEGGSSRNKPS